MNKVFLPVVGGNSSTASQPSYKAMLSNGSSAHWGAQEYGWKVVPTQSQKKRCSRGRVQGNFSLQDGEVQDLSAWPTIPMRARMDTLRPTSPFDSRRRDEENSRKVFVGSLSEYTTSAELWEFFEAELGKVQDARVIYCKDETGEEISKGFGFVHFEEQEDADKALSQVYFLLGDTEVVVKTAFSNKKMEFGREEHSMRSTSGDSVFSPVSIHPHAPNVQLGNDGTQKPPASHVVWTGTQVPPASSVAGPTRGGTHPYIQLPDLFPQSRGQYLPPSTRVPVESNLSREHSGPRSENVHPSSPVKFPPQPFQYNILGGTSPHHTSRISYEPYSFYNGGSNSSTLHTLPSNHVADSRVDKDEELSKLLGLLSSYPIGSSSPADRKLARTTNLHSEITSLPAWSTIPTCPRMGPIPPTAPVDSTRRHDENSRKVFVGSLSEYTTSAELWEFFEAELGKVHHAKVIYCKDEMGKDCSKRFGFVHFEKQEAADEALSRVHFLLGDTVVVVKTAFSKNKMELGREEESLRSTSQDSVFSRMSIHPHAPVVQLGNDGWPGTQVPPAYLFLGPQGVGIIHIYNSPLFQLGFPRGEA